MTSGEKARERERKLCVGEAERERKGESEIRRREKCVSV